MASQDMGLVPSQRLENGLNSQLVYQDESSIRFNCAAPPQRRVGDPGPKTRELSGFIDSDKMFSIDRDRYFSPQAAEFRRSIYGDPPDRRDHPDSQNWHMNGRPRTPSGDASDDDEDEDEDDEDDDVDEGDGEVEALVAVDDGNHNKTNNTNSSGSVHSCGVDKIGSTKGKHHSSFGGSNRDVLTKEGNFVQSASNTRPSPSESNQLGRVNHYSNAVTIAEPDGDMYFSQFLQGPEGSASGQKDVVMENGCGFSGRKEVAYSSESGESLRAILSDPITGALMDDAMILPCGHSFGNIGIQHVLRVKACFTCSQSISKDSVAPNLSLRAAVQAFHREEELQLYRASKRRRERFEQDKGNYGDSFVDPPRGRGVQFPFAVTDRVIIKGNKRTPQRFVGREAVVTTQCLNGWYVVKTLDNAESVKLQYRSLAKISDTSSSKPMSGKTPNWL